jgi:hypothetical protein
MLSRSPMPVDAESEPVSSGRVLVCTFDPWHTVQRFELRIVRLWKRLPAGDDSQILSMSEGLPLCAVCHMLMESVAVPPGASAVTALRMVAENFAEAMERTRRR